MQLKGKICLVTGGARRIGLAIALEMAKQGCSIALHYHRSKTEAKEAQNQIRALGVPCNLFAADLSKPKAADALALKVIRVFGACDVLVNSAAIFPRKRLEQAQAIDFDEPYALNLRAPALLSKAVGAWNILNKRQARIINIGDASGLLTWPSYLPYSLSKAGLVHLTRSSARQMAPWVLVNCVAPGPMLPTQGATAKQQRASLEQTLLKKFGGAEAVAQAVAFLAQSDFITGAVLPVDGGRHLLG
jgi:NAD(P)-dependent dehydrogenase (short-subunit alcohol dehydrogenase family)